MNLDGETNLKERTCPSETKNITEEELKNLKGEIICEKPNELLTKWESTLYINSRPTVCGTKQLLLKGCSLKNTEFIYGIIVYTGHNTKIMKNAKNPPLKTSNVMRVMNNLLYSIFIFLLSLCLIFSICFIIWQDTIGKYQVHIMTYDTSFKLTPLEADLQTFCIKFLTFIVAYSHLIPISLYVALEVVKLIQGLLIFYDEKMLDEITAKPAYSKTSELIEELGQVHFLFSDKTGTLTKNEMIFKKCAINNKVFNDFEEKSKSLNDILSCESNMENEKEKQLISDFFTICSVCHSAYIEIYKQQIVYQVK